MTRRQPFSSARIPSSAAVTLVGLRGGSSEPQAEPMIISRADSESRAVKFNFHPLVRASATQTPKSVLPS